MAEQLRVFVSHTSEDSAFCHTIVAALRGAGADVWYDEHNMGSGRLADEILRELGRRLRWSRRSSGRRRWGDSPPRLAH
ncbi:MAG TPA: toll/interleukin-1 receptor domain-containing protein [Ktedonobacterales bacterium]|jgi:hypothetical protein